MCGVALKNISKGDKLEHAEAAFAAAQKAVPTTKKMLAAAQIAADHTNLIYQEELQELVLKKMEIEAKAERQRVEEEMRLRRLALQDLMDRQGGEK